jgi:hypothetical protein
MSLLRHLNIFLLLGFCPVYSYAGDAEGAINNQPSKVANLSVQSQQSEQTEEVDPYHAMVLEVAARTAAENVKPKHGKLNKQKVLNFINSNSKVLWLIQIRRRQSANIKL